MPPPTVLSHCTVMPQISAQMSLKKCIDTAYRVEHGTVSENELNISNKLVDNLVTIEVSFA